MKKILLCLVITLSLCATSVFAQQTGKTNQKEQRQQMMKQYLKDTVQLSDVIADSVMTLRVEFQPQMKTISKDQSLSADEKKSKMQELKTQMETRYKAVGLNDNQIKEIEDHDQRIREEMRNHMNNGNGSGGQ